MGKGKDFGIGCIVWFVVLTVLLVIRDACGLNFPAWSPQRLYLEFLGSTFALTLAHLVIIIKNQEMVKRNV
jgi:hypothetical protein